MDKKIWYVEFPTYQYNEDVKALAREKGLTIVDAQFDDGKGVKDAPELTKKVDNVDDGEVLSKDDKKFNALIVKLDVLKDKEIEFCAKHLGFEFTTKDETVAKIKEFLELK